MSTLIWVPHYPVDTQEWQGLRFHFTHHQTILEKFHFKNYLEQIHISVQNSKLIFSAPTTLNCLFSNCGFSILRTISQIKL